MFGKPHDPHLYKQANPALRQRENPGCRCGQRLARCSRCGDIYCPKCNQPHMLSVDGVAVFLCQLQGGRRG